MKRFDLIKISFLALSLCLVGCSTNRSRIQSFRYHENAKQKPIAALVPMVSHVEIPKISWDITQEITADVQRRIINRANIYLNPVQISHQLRAKLSSRDLIALSKDDLRELSAENEFAIFMELLEHQEVPYAKHSPRSAVEMEGQTPKMLVIKARVRVYDLRGAEPKILLQEILKSEHYLSRDSQETNYQNVVWGVDSYPASVYGRAHAKLEKNLASQIENYITISK